MIDLLKCIPMDYSRCLELQRKLNELRNEDKIGDTMIATEHDDTYTGGIHFNTENEGNYSVPIIRVERGGNLTYHGKGQLVLYFIFSLKGRGINVRDLIEQVQEAINDTLGEYGLKGEGRLYRDTGVWVEGRKICSIGFAVKGFSTLHGIAVNLNTDMDKFFRINPCDLDPGVMTSLSREIGRQVDEDQFLERMIKNLSKIFREEIKISDRKCTKN